MDNISLFEQLMPDLHLHTNDAATAEAFAPTLIQMTLIVVAGLVLAAIILGLTYLFLLFGEKKEKKQMDVSAKWKLKLTKFLSMSFFFSFIYSIIQLWMPNFSILFFLLVVLFLIIGPFYITFKRPKIDGNGFLFRIHGFVLWLIVAALCLLCAFFGIGFGVSIIEDLIIK